MGARTNMSNVKWEIEETTQSGNDRTFIVTPRSGRWSARYQDLRASVWVDGATARCTRCCSLRIAMLTTCVHARAVKRFLAKKGRT